MGGWPALARRRVGLSKDVARRNAAKIRSASRIASRDHRQLEASSCFAFAISALALASWIFRFTLPRLQKRAALLGSRRIASL
jgi:hypothetical protein